MPRYYIFEEFNAVQICRGVGRVDSQNHNQGIESFLPLIAWGYDERVTGALPLDRLDNPCVFLGLLGEISWLFEIFSFLHLLLNQLFMEPKPWNTRWDLLSLIYDPPTLLKRRLEPILRRRSLQLLHPHLLWSHLLRQDCRHPPEDVVLSWGL